MIYMYYLATCAVQDISMVWSRDGGTKSIFLRIMLYKHDRIIKEEIFIIQTLHLFSGVKCLFHINGNMYIV